MYYPFDRGSRSPLLEEVGEARRDRLRGDAPVLLTDIGGLVRRVHADRDEGDVPPGTVPEQLLDPNQVRHEDRAYFRAVRVDEADENDLPPEHVGVEADFLPVLGQKRQVGEIGSLGVLVQT